MSGRRWTVVRRLAIACLLLAVSVWAVDRWLVVGWLRPVWIYDLSMAPHFLGQHLVITCDRCGQTYRIEPLVERPSDARSTCASCGQIHTLPEADEEWELRAGERVRINRLHRWLHAPRRWEVWAFEADDWHQAASEAGQRLLPVPMVKRVVGLPGERLQFLHGELWVDGKLLKKSLDDVRQLSVGVMNAVESPLQNGAADAPPTADVQARWSTFRPASESTRWKLGQGGYLYRDATSREPNEFDWLVFQGVGVVGRQVSHGRLWDDDSFQQSVSRSLHPMQDFLLTAQIQGSRDVQWACQIETESRQSWRCQWDFQKELVTIHRNTQLLASASTSKVQPAAGVSGQIQWAFWDDQWAVCWNGQPVLMLRELASSDGPRGLRELKLGARGGEIRLKSVRLERDTYWYDSRWEALGEATQRIMLGHDEYFVVGDNVSQSVDSRQWGPVRDEQFLGPVRKVR